MIELKIDRDRITELAPLRLETVLFGDTGPVSIVAPREEAFRKIAEEAQADLRQRTDAEAPLLDEEEFAGANGLPGNVIAVGHGAFGVSGTRSTRAASCSRTCVPSISSAPTLIMPSCACPSTYARRPAIST